MDVEKENRSQLLKEQEKKKASLQLQEKKRLNAEKVSRLDTELEEHLLKLNVAQNLIADGNQTLSNLTIGKGKVDKDLVLKAQMVISAGVERSKNINARIDELRKEIKSFSK